MLDKYYKSLGATILGIVAYFYSGSNKYLDEMLPMNGKPLAIGSIIGMVVLYDLLRRYRNDTDRIASANHKEVLGKIIGIERLMAKTSLVQAVNRVYDSVERSGVETIVDEYLIIEIRELTDLREELQVNSYTQGKLINLNDKIKKI